MRKRSSGFLKLSGAIALFVWGIVLASPAAAWQVTITFDELSNIRLNGNVDTENFNLVLEAPFSKMAPLAVTGTATVPLPSEVQVLTLWVGGPEMNSSVAQPFIRDLMERCERMAVLAEARESTHDLEVTLDYEGTDPGGNLSQAGTNGLTARLPAVKKLQCQLIE